MSESFNLLTLSASYDSHPRSWICISGTGVRTTVSQLEKRIRNESGLSREALAKKISNKFGVSLNVIKNILRGVVQYYPIPVINEMAAFCDDKESVLSHIESKIETLKVNSSSSLPVRAARLVDKTLSQIVGAFMADGSLSYRVVIASKNPSEIEDAKRELRKRGIDTTTQFSKPRSEYYLSLFPNYSNFETANEIIGLLRPRYSIQTSMVIELTDYHKDNVEAFNGWIHSLFGVSPARMERKKNAWRTTFSNKILARYLIRFFGIKSGYKTDIAFEPDAIREADLDVRRAFAKGAIMFDGSATMAGTISYLTKSRKLFNSLADILGKDGLRFCARERHGMFIISTTRKNDPEKLLQFFERGTDKWLRLKEVYGPSHDKSGYSARYAPQPGCKITMAGIKQTMKETGCCDFAFLLTKFGGNHAGMSSYINILKNNGVVRVSKEPNSFNPQAISPATAVYLHAPFHELLFSRLAETFGEYQEAARYLGVHKATISAWKVRKNRVPIRMLAKMCAAANIEASETRKNVQETDRMVIEAI